MAKTRRQATCHRIRIALNCDMETPLHRQDPAALKRLPHPRPDPRLNETVKIVEGFPNLGTKEGMWNCQTVGMN